MFHLVIEPPKKWNGGVARKSFAVAWSDHNSFLSFLRTNFTVLQITSQLNLSSVDYAKFESCQSSCDSTQSDISLLFSWGMGSQSSY
jgi:hypothetical protein